MKKSLIKKVTPVSEMDTKFSDMRANTAEEIKKLFEVPAYNLSNDTRNTRNVFRPIPPN